MAGQYALSSEHRAPGHGNRDRAAGFVPAVMYGHRVDPVVLRVEQGALGALLTRGGAHHLIELTVQGQDAPHTVVVKEIQHHPVSRRVVHIDFQAVSAKERIHAEVPLRLLGEEAVAKAGAVLQVLLHSLHISCLPGDLPERLDVEVAGVAVGHSLAVRDIRVPEAVQVLNDADEVVLSVLPPRTVEPEAPAAEPAAAGPEAKA